MTDPLPPSPSSPAARAAAPRNGRLPRVLVVDDEADLRELLDLTLIRMGLDVDCASTLDQARRFLAQ
ncbi:MAG TPA: sigma-54-dependent Fis family transcriptional regulator, partial [Burkholderiaceae bacterium]|nr:sigma-54-dependent Fis family transcriptional regulator [Burkholderiaceae bacterium]